MDKSNKLNKILRELGSVVIAYSGGLDSTFLLKAAIDALGPENVLAVTARSETYPASEYAEARRIAKSLGARLVTIRTSELGIKNFKDNPVNRCYYCKKELFKKLDRMRKARKMGCLLDGTNLDDLNDVRHGRRAAKEFGVKRPLLDARITKDDIRRLSRRLELPTWNKPSFACLASRIPFNSRITAGGLKRVGEAEEYLRRLGFRQVRVRLHGNIARIEVYKDDFNRMVRLSRQITEKLKKMGFVYAALDLTGYRTGSMHEAIAAKLVALSRRGQKIR